MGPVISMAIRMIRNIKAVLSDSWSLKKLKEFIYIAARTKESNLNLSYRLTVSHIWVAFSWVKKVFVFIVWQLGGGMKTLSKSAEEPLCPQKEARWIKHSESIVKQRTEILLISFFEELCTVPDFISDLFQHITECLCFTNLQVPSLSPLSI